MASRTSIMIVAGEASADLHGAALVRAIGQLQPTAQVWGAGGAAMRSAGFDAAVDAESISVAGLTEVLFSVPRIWGRLRKLARLARERRPSVIVLIDLPDFNLRLAKRVRDLGIPIVYYISPQVWAWREKRVEQIRTLVDQMLCILPFEQAFYQKHGVRAQFVGHPLVAELPTTVDRAEARSVLGLSSTQTPIIALLPGSRPKEISRHLPVMLAGMDLLKRHFPDVTVVIPVASTIPRKQIERYAHRSRVPSVIVDDQAVEALSAADAAVVCSGTATLQAALLSRPFVVVYRVSWLTYQVVKRMIRVGHIALANLIAGRRVVPELIQRAFTPAAVNDELRRILEDPLVRIRFNQDFGEVRNLLGRGNASARAAQIVCNYLPEKRRTTMPVPGTLASVRAVAGAEDDG